MVQTPRSHPRRTDYIRLIPSLVSSHRTFLALVWTVGFVLICVWQRTAVDRLLEFRRWGPPPRPVPRLRRVVFNLTDFGGVGDGATVNTEAFERAVSEIRKRGGGQLNVQRGVWLTAPFNLTSHMTLFLAENAVILGIDDERYWTLMPPLPSYGYGREHPGPRYGSLIHGQNLKDVVITGQLRGGSVACADSCENMVIENTYISVGDDGVAIKSGWDQYGIAYSRPSTNILIRNLIVRSMARRSVFDTSTDIFLDSAGVSIGSEMSGGISNITVENLIVWNSRRAVRIKTSPGRGGYVQNLTYRNLTLENVRVGVVIKTDYNEHPDEGYEPEALPVIKDISFTGIRGHGVRVPVRIYGSQEIPVRNVTIRDMSVGITYKKKHIFQCSFLQGRVIGSIFPAPCENFDLYDEQGRLVKQSKSQNNTDIDYEALEGIGNS
ncbi:hypothetical protein RJ639_010537 [Escallonia herrerae]|uniref:Glycoside hydrolase family 28 n=1 Tax=Escallonia herrerae TaxID=1293975 RepID=A0AA88VMK3_9ASTE|nr:hypothetical protein RJ639_010537 [Escallonia herrerae]